MEQKESVSFHASQKNFEVITEWYNPFSEYLIGVVCVLRNNNEAYYFKTCYCFMSQSKRPFLTAEIYATNHLTLAVQTAGSNPNPHLLYNLKITERLKVNELIMYSI